MDFKKIFMKKFITEHLTIIRVLNKVCRCRKNFQKISITS